MTAKRRVEVFSAGCEVCEAAVALVKSIACESCQIEVLDMNDPGVAEKARELGVRSVPAVAIDGTLAECCAGGGVDEAALRALGLGSPASA